MTSPLAVECLAFLPSVPILLRKRIGDAVQVGGGVVM
jgi:hypothetical protein